MTDESVPVLSTEEGTARIDSPPEWPHFFDSDEENPDRCFHDDELWPCWAERVRLELAAERAAFAARVAELEGALRRLDGIARVDPLNEKGDAELRAALDQSYWLLHPEKPSALDKAARADAERVASEETHRG